MSSNRSKDGYDGQRSFTDKIVAETRGMKSVTHTDFRGRPVRSGADVPHGADEGKDLITIVETRNEQSASRVQNLILRKARQSRNG
ncbi:MAG: hypothetical protein JWP57_4625 [Spirosoma sp.]|nr:hypothetical protein [Spirosoma sp.]